MEILITDTKLQYLALHTWIDPCLSGSQEVGLCL